MTAALTPTQLARLTRRWYRKAGLEDDAERGGMLVHETGDRSADAQDIGFAGEMADAARDILTHPQLTRKQRRIWRLHVSGGTYDSIARTVKCSFRSVSATLDLVQGLMLRPGQPETPKGKLKMANGKPGRPAAVHMRDGRSALCGKDVDKSVLTNDRTGVTCSKCLVAMGGKAKLKTPGRVKTAPKIAAAPKRRGRPPKVARETSGEVGSYAHAFEVTIPPEVEEAAQRASEEFTDLETSIGYGVEIAHRKLIELRTTGELSPGDLTAAERCTALLLNVRKSELELHKAKLPGLTPAPADKVRETISADKAKEKNVRKLTGVATTAPVAAEPEPPFAARDAGYQVLPSAQPASDEATTAPAAPPAFPPPPAFPGLNTEPPSFRDIARAETDALKG